MKKLPPLSVPLQPASPAQQLLQWMREWSVDLALREESGEAAAESRPVPSAAEPALTSGQVR